MPRIVRVACSVLLCGEPNSALFLIKERKKERKETGNFDRFEMRLNIWSDLIGLDSGSWTRRDGQRIDVCSMIYAQFCPFLVSSRYYFYGYCYFSSSSFSLFSSLVYCCCCCALLWSLLLWSPWFQSLGLKHWPILAIIFLLSSFVFL